MDINAIALQLPNFVGFLVAIAYLWRNSTRQQTTIDKLIDVIVERQNCDDDDTPQQRRSIPPRTIVRD